MIEVTVRCGCTRTMRADGAMAGWYRCGCGAAVSLTGLPKLDKRHCSLPKGNRVCNGPKLPEATACEPCSVLIAKEVLRDTAMAEQIGTESGMIAYYAAQRAEQERLLAVLNDPELARVDRRPGAANAAVVYYCELRPGIVKIGTTMDLAGRMGSLHVPAGAVLAAEPGHYELEKARHREFAHLRIGQREDFRVDEGLRAYVEELAQAHGDPFALLNRLRVEQQKLAETATQS